MVAPTYVSENSPRAIRGLLLGFYQLFETMGAMIAFFIDYGALLHIKGHGSWMVPLAMQSLPPVLIFASILFCPESPRWLAAKDNWDSASRVLSDVRNLPVDHPYVQQELLELRTQIEEEQRSVHGTGFWATQKECWLIPGNRKRALLSIGLMIAQQASGTNAINYYAPTIFTALGITGNATSLLATGVYGIVKMCSCAIFITFLADTLGRRWSFVWTAFAMFFCMFYLGFYVRFDPPVKGAAIPAAGYVALVMVYLFAAAFQFGWGPVCWIYVSEIPTNRLRGYNVSLAAATQWLFNLVVARVSPVMLVNAGGPTGYGTYFIYGSFCFAMGCAAFFVPETKGVSGAAQGSFGVRVRVGLTVTRSLSNGWTSCSVRPTSTASRTLAWLPSIIRVRVWRKPRWKGMRKQGESTARQLWWLHSSLTNELSITTTAKHADLSLHIYHEQFRSGLFVTPSVSYFVTRFCPSLSIFLPIPPTRQRY